ELASRAAGLARIRALRERLGTEQRREQGPADEQPPAIEAKEQRSFADGDARLMRMKRGEYDDAYNARAAVDGASGLIVAAGLTNVAPDVGHLPDLVAPTRATSATTRWPKTGAGSPCGSPQGATIWPQ